MQRFSFRLGGLALAVAALVYMQPAKATLVRFLTLEEHLALSELVVRAKVLGEKSFVGEGGLPFTDTELEILETLAGEARERETLRLRQLRGEVDGLVRIVPGDAHFEEGEEVILFLHGLEGDVAYLTALGQSKYAVERPVGPPSPGDGGAHIIRDLSNSAFYEGGNPPSMSLGQVEAPLSLGDFRERLREQAEGAR